MVDVTKPRPIDVFDSLNSLYTLRTFKMLVN